MKSNNVLSSLYRGRAILTEMIDLVIKAEAEGVKFDPDNGKPVLSDVVFQEMYEDLLESIQAWKDSH